jgi:hypothetical protein
MKVSLIEGALLLSRRSHCLAPRCPIGFSVSRTERRKLEEIPFLLVSHLPHAPRTIRETMPLSANVFDNHVGAAGFQSNNVSDLKLMVHF